MCRAVVAAVVAAAAVLVQLAVVNAVPLPGGARPDLVLLAVLSLGLACGPATGMTAGFCAGLALDLAPPASLLAGEYALVCCVAGYCCGRLGRIREGSLPVAILLAAATAAAAELLTAGIALALNGPVTSWAAVRQQLPAAVLADVVLCPVIVLAVLPGTRWLGVAAPVRDNSPAGELAGTAGPTVGGRAAGGRWRPGWAAASRSRSAAIAAARLRHPSAGRPGLWVGGQPAGATAIAARGGLPRRNVPAVRFARAPGLTGARTTGGSCRGYGPRPQARSGQRLTGPSGRLSAVRSSRASVVRSGRRSGVRSGRPAGGDRRWWRRKSRRRWRTRLGNLR